MKNIKSFFSVCLTVIFLCSGACHKQVGNLTSELASGKNTVIEPKIPQRSVECPVFEPGYIFFKSGEATFKVKVLMSDGGQEDKNSEGKSLILYWHGTGESGDYVIDTDKLENSKEVSIGDGKHLGAFSDELISEMTEDGNIVLAPFNEPTLGEVEGKNISGSNVWREGHLELADVIVACAVESGLVDPERIYITGLSAGGLMATHMTWSRADYIAASGVFSGGFIEGLFSPFFEQPKSPGDGILVNTVLFHGGDDDVEFVDFKENSENYIVASAALPGDRWICDHEGGHRQFAEDSGAFLRLGDISWGYFQTMKYGDNPDATNVLPDYCLRGD